MTDDQNETEPELFMETGISKSRIYSKNFMNCWMQSKNWFIANNAIHKLTLLELQIQQNLLKIEEENKKQKKMHSNRVISCCVDDETIFLESI